MQHNISSVINFTDKFSKCQFHNKSIMKLMWRFVLEANGGEKQRETTQGKAWNRVMEWKNEGKFRREMSCQVSLSSSPCRLQTKTEMVYLVNAPSVQFHLSALETECKFWPFQGFYGLLFVLMGILLLCSICFAVLLSSYALVSLLYRQLLINSQQWLLLSFSPSPAS